MHNGLLVRKQWTGFLALLLVLIAGLACNTRSDDEWTRGLAHKKLSRANTSGSISNKTTFYFCPGGEYAMVTDFSGFSGGGAGTLSMADRDIEQGRWAVRSGQLLVQSETGERRSYDISSGVDPDVVQLNGDGFLVEEHSECQ